MKTVLILNVCIVKLYGKNFTTILYLIRENGFDFRKSPLGNKLKSSQVGKVKIKQPF